MSAELRSVLYCDDGTLLIPSVLCSAMVEELDARNGRLTVSQAQTLVEKWTKESARR